MLISCVYMKTSERSEQISKCGWNLNSWILFSGHYSEKDFMSNTIIRSEDFTLFEVKCKDAKHTYQFTGFAFIKQSNRINNIHSEGKFIHYYLHWLSLASLKNSLRWPTVRCEKVWSILAQFSLFGKKSLELLYMRTGEIFIYLFIYWKINRQLPFWFTLIYIRHFN